MLVRKKWSVRGLVGKDSKIGKWFLGSAVFVLFGRYLSSHFIDYIIPSGR